jgi:RNA polymerase sigma-70 factor (ECF subfamily)
MRAQGPRNRCAGLGFHPYDETAGPMSDRDDWQLVESARQGDERAFATLVDRYQEPVVNFCWRMVGSRQDAEDLAQDSFVRLYRYLGRIEPRAKFSTALFGIARNLTLNYIRDQKRRGRGRTASLARNDETERPVEDHDAVPDRQARLQEIGRLIEQAMQELTPRHREVLILRELEGLDYDSIARVVRCSKGTVKSRINRAREQLRLRLIALGGEDL